jgi:hypothetical protein
MNHGKTTLIFGSILVVGTLTGVALAILLKQNLEDREKDLFVIGTHGNSLHLFVIGTHGKNELVKSADDHSVFGETISSNGTTNLKFPRYVH